ncbi:RIP metalloprotease RseP [Phenylobacterium sp. SCN 70-31]|uniref:RIP metalloprotease RseP n=1 Tax=Phenylobacterium sp. SCN 70-31 TaxID=1660129 RepID=UPI00086F4224|nr:RIP metalloprotease RseP [Phenylobacterium sp. SCN 70-31]ODT88006.1 MAG: RIP metalloprotease RseP [Phenylobacterium sp. SCN 70-31]
MLSFIQTALLYVVPFLLVLGVVVTVHELGHFLAAKALGTKIDRFSIGFGRAIAAWTDKDGVEWRVGWLPLGGYVRFAGDDNAASIPDAEDLADMRRDLVAQGRGPEISRYFHFKPIWQRAIIVAAGPFINFALAIAIFAGILMSLGDMTLPFRVQSVTPDSPAAAAGFRPGDRVVAVNGREMTAYQEIVQIIEVRGGVPIRFTVDRGGARLDLTATPEWQMKEDRIAGKRRAGAIGITPAQSREDFVHVEYGPLEALQGGVVRTWSILTTTIDYLGRMISGQVSTDQLRGPLGIADITGKVTAVSTEGAPDVGAMLGGAAFALVQLIAVISVSIGFMNLLPVPVLDGGHLMFYAYEAVARRPLAAKVQAAGYRVGLALVLGLMLFATWNDLQRLRVFNLFGGLFS